MKKLTIVFFSVLIVFGINTVYFKNYPYNKLYTFYVKIKKLENINYSGRNLDFDKYNKVEFDFSESTGVFLTYGQSNTTNSGETGYIPSSKVYQFLFGEIFEYKEPSLGGNGRGSSVWGMVGDKLINSGKYESVIFSNCGYGGKKIQDLNKGVHFNFLVSNYNSLMTKLGKVDGILFHQGEGNSTDQDIDNYYDDFVLLLENLENEGIKIPIFLSRVSYCGGKESPQLLKIQNQLINDFSIIKLGPNTDLIKNKNDRYDDCHFSLSGLEKISTMWVESLTY